jgi:hypothetical protein
VLDRIKQGISSVKIIGMNFLKRWVFQPSHWRKLKARMIEQNAYLTPEFKLENLANSTHLTYEQVEVWSMEVYGKPFDKLVQGLRIKRLVYLKLCYKEQVSIRNYARLSGFRDRDTMVQAFWDEQGIDFFYFYEKVIRPYSSSKEVRNYLMLKESE